MSVWSDVAAAVGEAAPVVGGLLGGPAGSAAGRLVASALGVEDDPDAVRRALAKDPEALAKIQALEQEHVRELRRMTLEAESTRLAQVNRTIRAEVTSEDAYVRRWRPTFGYAVALAWTVQMGGLTYAVVMTPEFAAEILNAITNMSVIWGVALSVLGINVAKRSQDKAVQAGQLPRPGLLDRLAAPLVGGTGRDAAR